MNKIFRIGDKIKNLSYNLYFIMNSKRNPLITVELFPYILTLSAGNREPAYWKA